MKIVINNTSMEPIYEQLVAQIKGMIMQGRLQENDVLPSVRTLAKQLKISALTVKKAYDNLENEGFTITIHGKGTYVASANQDLLREEIRKEAEMEIDKILKKAIHCGMSKQEINDLFTLIWEEL